MFHPGVEPMFFGFKQTSSCRTIQTTRTHAFQKSLTKFLKLRAEKRKAEIGFEAQYNAELAKRRLKPTVAVSATFAVACFRSAKNAFSSPQAPLFQYSRTLRPARHGPQGAKQRRINNLPDIS
jgi:hypothetical protein